MSQQLFCVHFTILIKMKLICAGYPKTGSKSCSSALRKLGYNVADYMETWEFLAVVWRDYVLGKGGSNSTLQDYHQLTFS